MPSKANVNKAQAKVKDASDSSESEERTVVVKVAPKKGDSQEAKKRVETSSETESEEDTKKKPVKKPQPVKPTQSKKKSSSEESSSEESSSEESSSDETSKVSKARPTGKAASAGKKKENLDDILNEFGVTDQKPSKAQLKRLAKKAQEDKKEAESNPTPAAAAEAKPIAEKNSNSG